VTSRTEAKGDRRTFVAGTTAGLAAVSTRGVLGANDRLGVAVIGVNGMGHSHVRTLAARPDVRIVALCDVDQGVLARAAKTVKDATGQEPALVGDFRRLLDDRQVEAVVVATPHHRHCPIALRALGAGKDVYVEKPASHVFREGRLLIEAATGSTTSTWRVGASASRRIRFASPPTAARSTWPASGNFRTT